MNRPQIPKTLIAKQRIYLSRLSTTCTHGAMQLSNTEQCNLATFKRATALPTPRRPHWFAGRHYNTLSLDVAVHGGFGRWSTSRLGASLSTVTQISSIHLPVIACSCSHSTKHRHKEPNSALPNTEDCDMGHAFQASYRPRGYIVYNYVNVFF